LINCSGHIFDGGGSLSRAVAVEREDSGSELSWQVEHRYRAVLEVRQGSPVDEVAVRYGASRQSIYNWKARFEAAGFDGLRDRSRRLHNSPRRMPAQVESLICELRRAHPRWGARRLAFELAQRDVEPLPVQATIHRALVRNGLVIPQQQRHKRKYRRWQREAPMHLWQLDLVGGIYLTDGRECKMLTGIDDHARYVVIAVLLAVPNGRAVCDAFAAAMRRYGVPCEVLTENGKQFTGRFTRPRPVEVLFERVCRDNGITALLTKARSPTTTGKIERFHQTLRRALLDNCGPFADLPAAQAAIDAWVHAYNHLRPHQALGMATPASLFRPVKTSQITSTPAPVAAESPTGTTVMTALASSTPVPPKAAAVVPVAGAVTFDYRVPPSGAFGIVPNAQQVWLGPMWSGRIITVWASERSIHLLADGHLIKTVPSRLTPQHLHEARARDAQPGGPEPAAPALPRVNGRVVLPTGQAVEVDRSFIRDGVVRIAKRDYHVNAELVGRRITLRLDGHLMHAITDNQLAGTWPCPIARSELAQLRGARPATEPLPHPTTPTGVRVQRRLPSSGITMVAGQRLRVGRIHAGKVVTIVVEDTHFRVLHGDEELSLHPRNPTSRPIRITAYNRRNP
jgi:transposase InsO family protein